MYNVFLVFDLIYGLYSVDCLGLVTRVRLFCLMLFVLLFVLCLLCLYFLFALVV